MIYSLFRNYFYSKFLSPNRTELLKYFDNPIKSSDQEFLWGKNCNVRKERLQNTDEVKKLLKPSIEKFFNLCEFRQPKETKITDIWKCLYDRGSYQETHDHCGNDLSGVLFLTDWKVGASNFYFYDRHCSEITEFWRRCGSFTSESITYKRGEILLFPAYMMHGVTQHNHRVTRKIVSFNLYFPLN